MSEIKFKRDTSFRKELFTADSFAHPAKMDAQLLIWIVEKYIKVGETILDPMAEMGTTMLACIIGRNVVLVELEQKFVKMQKANWDKVKMMPQLGYEMGSCQIIQGDARNLEGLLVDGIITSPPFAGANQRQDIEFLKKIAADQSEKYRTGENQGHYASTEAIKRYYEKQSLDASKDNIQNLPYGSIDSVITSPPYEGIEARDRSKETSFREGQPGIPKRGDINISKGYSVDSIITSPPYEGMKQDDTRANDPEQIDKRAREFEKAGGNFHTPGRMATIPRHYAGYTSSSDNIGNLKADSYLSAMLQVYQQCYKVLKPWGLMILVTKNFIRNKKEVRLDEDTIKLCEQAGFKFLERHYRKLPAQSFWRVIYRQKYPDAPVLDKEDILVFQKGEHEPGTGQL